jgi:glycosyltransferase involved in cell wall biosynthesis
MERVLCTKANYLADNAGINVYIILKYALPADFFYDFSPSVNILSLGFAEPSRKLLTGYFSRFRTKQEYRRKLNSVLYSLDPDVVISLFGDELSFLYKFKFLKFKIAEFHYSRNYLVHLVKSLPGLRYRRFRLIYVRWKQYRQRIIASRYDKVVLLTERDRQLWGNKPNIETIPNPRSFRSETKAELNNKQIVAIGRLISQKGFDLLIKIFADLADNYSDWSLLIIGKGQEHKYLTELIDKYKMSSRVFIKTPQKDIIRILLDSSIYALPSRYEGFGLVLTEAMECGVPCVAFDCECGPSEIITDGIDGFLVQDGNAEKFKNALKLLMADESLRKTMGENGRINVQRFSVESVMQRWLDLFSGSSSGRLK